MLGGRVHWDLYPLSQFLLEKSCDCMVKGGWSGTASDLPRKKLLPPTPSPTPFPPPLSVNFLIQRLLVRPHADLVSKASLLVTAEYDIEWDSVICWENVNCKGSYSKRCSCLDSMVFCGVKIHTENTVKLQVHSVHVTTHWVGQT